ncbi:uncharacterized protein [Dysidea avara]|uniref:uncharacterized protein isoform X2 n=1 Tax=Dysidea avara TaxID=196820 RepID=UPI003324DCE7
MKLYDTSYKNDVLTPVMYVITIGVLTGICGACCIYIVGSAVPDVPPSPFIRRTQRRTPLTHSPPVYCVVDAMVTTPVNNSSPSTRSSSVVTTVSMERSNSVPLEYVTLPLICKFVYQCLRTLT